MGKSYYNYDYDSVGKFNVTSGKIVICDPCYELENALEYDNCKVVEVPNGKWFAEVYVNEDSRVEDLFCARNGYKYKAIDTYEEEFPETAAVDSGQMSIFDYDHFVAHEHEREYNNEQSWYRKVCNITAQDECGIYEDAGVVTTSGYGDGCYDVIIGRDSITNEVWYIRVIFIEEKDDYDYEDEDY